MLRELLAIFRASDPLDEISRDFNVMLKLTHEMILAAGEAFFGEPGTDAATRTRLYEQDRRVNELERTIRRNVFTHLTVHGSKTDVPFSLLLMSLVKDVERLGDYAKNLSQVELIDADPLPEGPLTTELRAIRGAVEQASEVLPDIFLGSKREEATELIARGREIARRCDLLVAEIGRSDCDSGTTTVLVLGTRYYKRLGGHVLNILSGVVMPLDRLDYFDESSVAPETSAATDARES